MHYEYVRKNSGWHIAVLNEANQREFLLGPFRSKKSASENLEQIQEFSGRQYNAGRRSERLWQERRKVS